MRATLVAALSNANHCSHGPVAPRTFAQRGPPNTAVATGNRERS